jgi:hypothetical protein
MPALSILMPVGRARLVERGLAEGRDFLFVA